MSPSSITAVITGASRGLGLEWVKQLSEDPSNLVIGVVRNPDQANMPKALLRQNVIIVKGDLSDLDSFQIVASDISKASGGKVDILVNNAGIMLGKKDTRSITGSTPSEWREEFNVNVVGLVFFTIALLPLLERGSQKKVVNITSMLGDVDYSLANPELRFASYSVTKASTTMVTAKFHSEYSGRGFIFLALNPGWVRTGLGGDLAPLQPRDSISECLSFVLRSGPADSGKFFSLNGRPEAVTN